MAASQLKKYASVSLFKPNSRRRTVPKGLLDDIPIYNVDRDRAWEAFIKRKDVKHLVEHGVFDKGFPLYGGYYDLWCQSWDRAWKNGFNRGFKSGHDWANKMNESKEKNE